MKHNLESLALPSINDKESIKKLQAKRDILQNERITYLMDRKNKDDFYVDTPIPIIHNKRYSNNSERSRCLKYTQVFLKLKQFIINDEYNDKLYVKEVITN